MSASSVRNRTPADPAAALFIPSLLFSSAGMISSARFHPQLAFFFRKDDFFRPVSSLVHSFAPQG